MISAGRGWTLALAGLADQLKLEVSFLFGVFHLKKTKQKELFALIEIQMTFRVVADTDRAEMMVETIFLCRFSSLQIHLAHKIGSQRWGGLVAKKPDRGYSARRRLSSKSRMVGNLPLTFSVVKSKNLTRCLNYQLIWLQSSFFSFYHLIRIVFLCHPHSS